MGNDKPPESSGIHSRLDDMQLSQAMRQALAQSRTKLETVADLLHIGAYEFARSEGVGLVVFRQAVDLLRRCGVSWPPDARLDKTLPKILSRGAKCERRSKSALFWRHVDRHRQLTAVSDCPGSP
jgi:hypothetical protein